MNTPGTGNARAGKYCPRCQTMTFRDREVCEHCGHQFRTGLGTGLGAPPLDAPITDEATLHRTMQFTLPPLPLRGGVAAPGMPEASRGGTDAPRRRSASVPALAAMGAGLALVGGLAYSHYDGAARTAKPSPAGVWETAPAGRAPQDARLRLTFQNGGGGSFSWAASNAPLRWRLDPDGRLALSIPPPADADAVSGTVITILNSHPWLWRVDRTQRRLVIGALSFTEK